MIDPKAPATGKARAPLVPAVARINVTEAKLPKNQPA